MLKSVLLLLQSKRLLFIFAVPAIVVTQYYFDIERDSNFRVTQPVVIPANAIKLVNLGLNSASSALMWLYAIQQIPLSTVDLIETANDLDPKFSYPYAFATLVLPSMGFPERAAQIGLRGISEADPDWRIPYYLATNYHIFHNDRKNAAIYFNIATETTGSPENIKRIAAIYGTSDDQLGQTKQIWLSIYETSEDEFILEKAKNNILHIEMIEMLTKAVSIYRSRFGSYPTTITDLITGNIIKEIPESPLGLIFVVKGNRITVQ